MESAQYIPKGKFVKAESGTHWEFNVLKELKIYIMNNNLLIL
tara:strand:+ start:935 stop:1060 length:126 start_codon:yes stop_codon:yes gene_type:complete